MRQSFASASVRALVTDAIAPAERGGLPASSSGYSGERCDPGESGALFAVQHPGPRRAAWAGQAVLPGNANLVKEDAVLMRKLRKGWSPLGEDPWLVVHPPKEPWLPRYHLRANIVLLKMGRPGPRALLWPVYCRLVGRAPRLPRACVCGRRLPLPSRPPRAGRLLRTWRRLAGTSARPWACGR